MQNIPQIGKTTQLAQSKHEGFSIIMFSIIVKADTANSYYIRVSLTAMKRVVVLWLVSDVEHRAGHV